MDLQLPARPCWSPGRGRGWAGPSGSPSPPRVPTSRSSTTPRRRAPRRRAEARSAGVRAIAVAPISGPRRRGVAARPGRPTSSARSGCSSTTPPPPSRKPFFETTRGRLGAADRRHRHRHAADLPGRRQRRWPTTAAGRSSASWATRAGSGESGLLVTATTRGLHHRADEVAGQGAGPPRHPRQRRVDRARADRPSTTTPARPTTSAWRGSSRLPAAPPRPPRRRHPDDPAARLAAVGVDHRSGGLGQRRLLDGLSTPLGGT